MDSIAASHAADPISIPGVNYTFFFRFLKPVTKFRNRLIYFFIIFFFFKFCSNFFFCQFFFSNVHLTISTHCQNIKTGNLKRRQLLRLAILQPCLAIFCHLHKYILQNLGADGHFEGLNMSKFQLDQNL